MMHAGSAPALYTLTVFIFVLSSWALSPSGRPRRAQGSCLVLSRVFVGLIWSCCSCVPSRHAMLIVPPVSSRRLRPAFPPVRVPCCPDVPCFCVINQFSSAQ
eukprot:scaffold80594_cov62-Phaeocystis_antarctica.AAC.1